MNPQEEQSIRKLFNSNKAEQYKSFTGAWNGALIAVLKVTDVFDADYDNFLARQGDTEKTE